MNTEEFIKRSKEIHGDKYDYSLVIYVNAKTKIIIICPVHGIFEQLPYNHLRGNGCKKCIIENSRMSDIIEKSNKIHKNEYDYSLIDLKTYKNNKTKQKVICPIHGVFETTMNNHISKKCGCLKCSIENSRIDNEEFLERSNIKHNNKYIYPSLNVNDDIIKIICPIHGTFEQNKNAHMNGAGCNKCKYDKLRVSNDEFLERSNIIHNHKYTYPDKINNTSQKIIIICPEHGEFEQRVSSHLYGNGCPKCQRILKEEHSKWERYVLDIRNKTERNKKKLFKDWDGFDYYDGGYIKENLSLKGTDSNYPTIDHKISIFYGYKNNISPEIIGDISNLCITKRYINSTKNSKTEDEYNKKPFI